MFTSMSMPPNIPAPQIPTFGGSSSISNTGCHGNMIGSYPPPYMSNSYYPNCNTNFTNVPPPGYNSMNYPGNVCPPLPMGNTNCIGPSNNHFVNAPSSFPPFHPNFSHPPGTFPNPAFPNNPGTFPNYSMFPPSNNPFSRPPPPITTTPPKNINYANNCKTRQIPNSAFQFNKYAKSMREKPTPYRYECCERGFMSKEEYDRHVSQHITCDKNNCKFSALPQVVAKHVKMQHLTGVFNRIVKGNSPEEIEKWISERKKHFPTQRKIEEKKVREEEMQKRGERYIDQKRGFNYRNSRAPGRQNHFSRNFNNRGPQMRDRKEFKKTSSTTTDSVTEQADTKPIKRKMQFNIEDDEDDCVLRNLPPFRGTVYYLGNDENSELADKDHGSICDNLKDAPGTNFFFDECDSDTVENCNLPSPVKQTECNVESKDISIAAESNGMIFQNSPDRSSTIVKEEKSIVNTLSSSLDLIKGYEFSDEEDDDKTEEISSKVESAANMEVEKSGEESGPEECSSKNSVLPKFMEAVIPSSKCDGEEESSETLSKNQARKRRKRREKKDDVEAKNEEDKEPVPPPPRYKRSRPPTLLEKLLAPEIRHERNVILQCIRYVVENEYFGIAQPK